MKRKHSNTTPQLLINRPSSTRRLYHYPRHNNTPAFLVESSWLNQSKKVCKIFYRINYKNQESNLLPNYVSNKKNYYNHLKRKFSTFFSVLYLSEKTVPKSVESSLFIQPSPLLLADITSIGTISINLTQRTPSFVSLYHYPRHNNTPAFLVENIPQFTYYNLETSTQRAQYVFDNSLCYCV